MRASLHTVCGALALALAMPAAVGAVPVQPQAAARLLGPSADLGPALAAGLDAPAPRRARLPSTLVVVRVDFADRPRPDIVDPLASIDSLFFGSHSSVRDYYARSSQGRLVLSGVVTPWLRLPRTLAAYADAAHEGRGVRGAYPDNARRMAEDAVRAADAWVDFAAFDNDGPDGQPASGDDDGLVDALIVVHAGFGSETGEAGTILSHTWTTQDVVPTADGVGAWRYATVAENSPLGVAAHEFGHLLGLADLYDRRSTTLLGGGLGDWSLMASGAWLDGGHSPADLDAASKLELGFVDAVVPQANTRALPLAATSGTQAGTVYRVWTNGRADFEYLVIENRQPRGLDGFLPGGGMLVYHVNLQRANNDDPESQRVALLQADGRRDIERRINNGDEGDAYPGLAGRLNAGTTPSTRADSGADTQIVVSGISAPTGRMSFDLQIEATPALVLEGLTCREQESGSDGDGMPEAGESLELAVQLRNHGLAAGALAVRPQSVVPGSASWASTVVVLPPLAKGDSATARLAFVPAASLPDPSALLVLLHVSDGAGWRDSLQLAVGIGSRLGFRACLGGPQSGAGEPCREQATELHVENTGGAGSWSAGLVPGEYGLVYRSATGARYANRADVALVTSPFNVQPGSMLRLLHAYQTQDDAAGWAMDGGRVEISVGGGAWEPIEPQAGYPRRLQRDSVPQLAGAGVFAGAAPRRWDTFALGARTGSARVRCRFVSGDSIGGPGWEIASLEVDTAGIPDVPHPRLDLFARPNPARFPARIVVQITAPLTWSAEPATLAIYDARGRLVRRVEHAPLPAESAWFGWDGTDASGAAVPSGVYLARAQWGGMRGATKLVVLR